MIYDLYFQVQSVIGIIRELEKLNGLKELLVLYLVTKIHVKYPAFESEERSSSLLGVR